MAVVIFYEKPGCSTNARQKRVLEAAGHTVVAKNLFTEPWTVDGLRDFFRGTPSTSWFNAAAPRIKSGEIEPEKIDPEKALTAMLIDPFLIRRPLVEVKGQKSAGFDTRLIASLLGNQNGHETMEGCARLGTAARCAEPDDTRPES